MIAVLHTIAVFMHLKTRQNKNIYRYRELTFFSANQWPSLCASKYFALFQGKIIRYV